MKKDLNKKAEDEVKEESINTIWNSVMELQDATNMGNQGYIEDWFHSVFFSQHHSTLQQLLAPSLTRKLVSHAHVFINIHV